ncbi:putative six-hairpin glycosidase [Rosellinia necatrix]|uniref:Putative six-hairpin glycosidase n=1 Tax=Rosellinia necatrix TaxID=77044 RepID=A0A1S7UHV9_ROSNE|nr:putative six-hairpin glycosidase [Rosellinia necatrix]
MAALRKFALLVLAFYSEHQVLAALDGAALAKQYFDNDAPWYVDRIPFFEASDAAIQEVYYYRWKIFRSHQRDLGVNGWITTEFIDDVNWQTFPSGSLNDATQFHLNEGRWCRDRRFWTDYATHMYGPLSNPRHFSENMAASIWNAYLVDGDQSAITGLLGSMQNVYNQWQGDHYDSSKGLFFIEPLADATEYTIASIDASCGTDGFGGGDSFRPSINAYQYGNALAIANIAKLTGNTGVANDYTARAAAIKANVQGSLWNSTYQHFIDRHYQATSCVKYWDFIRGRELVGYAPWLHDLPDDSAVYAQAWKHILDSSRLGGPYGLRTNEPSYQYYMVQYRYLGDLPECQWNGPVWPYQTSQTLGALANVLDHYPTTAAQNVITTSDYMRLLTQYANMHYNKNRGGLLDIEEDYNGDTGAPIVGLDRSPHYFHSSFVDLVISGLVGIRPRADDVLEINPLGGSLSYFRLQGVRYHGNEVAIQWDSTGSRYGTKGLVVEVGGAVVATSATMRRITVNVSRKSPLTPKRHTSLAIQLQNKAYYSDIPAYPVGSVSVANADAFKVQDAIDGRTWFFQQPTNSYQIPHGWQTPAGTGASVWYMVDFGTSTSLQSAELAFYADSSVGTPTSYHVEYNTSSGWKSVSNAKYPTIVANGITYASWTAVSASQFRLVFTAPTGKPSRLVQWKSYSDVVDGTVYS